jgi:plexin A
VKGPVSGGTRVTLSGQHLDAGGRASLTLTEGDGDDTTLSLSINCTFVERLTWNTSICITSAATRPFHARHLQLSIDDVSIPHNLPEDREFVLLADPVITAVTPDRTIVR